MVPQLSQLVSQPFELSRRLKELNLSPTETQVLNALNIQMSLERLCERLNFEYTEQEVLESLKSLLSKELVTLVCSAYPWGVEFDYLSKEAASDGIE